MSRIKLIGLPEPPEGEHWCGVCVGAVKAIINDSKRVMDEAQAAAADGKPDGLVPIGTSGLKGLGGALAALQMAVTTAPAVQVPGAPLLELCWTHAPAIEDGPRSNGRGKRVAGSAPIPGLIRGEG